MYLGSFILEFYVHFSEECIRKLMTWDSNVTPTETLKDAAGSSAHDRIKDDPKSFSAHFNATMKMNDFQGIKYEEGQEDSELLYIYRHSRHLTYSNILTTMMSKLCLIQECRLGACRNQPCHEVYYLYFFSNHQCAKLMDELQKNYTTKLPNLFETGCFGTQKAAGSYKEDDWTKRLFHCLRLKKHIKAEFAAPYRANQVGLQAGGQCWGYIMY